MGADNTFLSRLADEVEQTRAVGWAVEPIWSEVEIKDSNTSIHKKETSLMFLINYLLSTWYPNCLFKIVYFMAIVISFLFRCFHVYIQCRHINIFTESGDWYDLLSMIVLPASQKPLLHWGCWSRGCQGNDAPRTQRLGIFQRQRLATTSADRPRLQSTRTPSFACVKAGISE